MSGAALEIAGIGMVTALGNTTHETIAALDRGDRRIVQTRLVDRRGDRIAGAFVLPVRDDLPFAARAELLAMPALTECLDSLPPVDGPTALFVCAPLPWGSFADDFAPAVGAVRDDWDPLTHTLAAHLEKHGLRGCSKRPVLLRRGHAAGVLALCHIQDLFDRGEVAQAVIASVDTQGERATLERLDLAGLLRSRRSPGGFVPGEAATVLCVRPVREDSSERTAAGRAPRDVVRGIGLGMESDPSTTALGLTSAISDALRGWGGAPRSVTTVAIDLNGERGRAKEWSFAATRTLWRDRATPALFHPAAQLGDVGAASVPLLAGRLACRTGAFGPALLVASSRDGLRAAAVLEGKVRGHGDGVIARRSG